MNEMRKDRRAPASLKVKYRSATVDEFVEQFGADVSRGGIFIKTKKPLDTGALLKFEFQLHGGAPVIHGVGRVAWRRPEDKARSDLPAGMGIKFIKLDDQSRGVIDLVEARHGMGSRFDQTENADLAPPLNSIPPGPQVGALLSPPPAGPSSRPSPSLTNRSFPSPAPSAPSHSNNQNNHEKPTFRPPPPAFSSIPPALADSWPEAGSKAPGSAFQSAAPAPRGALSSSPSSAPKGALGSSFPATSRGPAKAPLSARSPARDTSEFLASAFSVGGAGPEVRSQARVQVERARRDPQSVDLANELFGDLSEPNEKAERADLSSDGPSFEGLRTPSEPKVTSPHERQLVDKIPSMDDLVNEATGAGGPSPSARRGSSPSNVSMPAAMPANDALPLSLALTTAPPPPPALDSESVTLPPSRPAQASGGRGPLLLILGGVLLVAVGAGAFFVVRSSQPSVAARMPAEVAQQPSAAVPAPAEPKADAVKEPAAAAAPAVDVDVPVTSEPRAAQLWVADKLVGTTPTTLHVAAQTPLEVSVRSHGYATKLETLNAEAGAAPKHIVLEPLTYALVIKSTPPGATVRVNDLTVESPQPLALGHLDGMVTVTIEKPGYQRMTRNLRPEDFQEQRGTMQADIAVSLSPLPGGVLRKAAAAPRVAPPPEPAAPSTVPPVVQIKPEIPADQAAPNAEPSEKPSAAAPAEKPSAPEPAPSPPPEPPSSAIPPEP